MKSLDGMVYIQMGKCTFLCIGTEAELAKADYYKIREMIFRALAISLYDSIKNSKPQCIN